MSVIQPVVTMVPSPGDVQAWQAQWTLGDGDVGAVVDLALFSDRSVQTAGGTFGGSSMIFQGSNNGANFVGLHDPFGVAIAHTSANLSQIIEASRYVRPSVSGGSGSGLVVTLYAKRSFR